MRNAQAHKFQWSGPTVHSSAVFVAYNIIVTKYLSVYLYGDIIAGKTRTFLKIPPKTSPPFSLHFKEFG